MVNVYLLMVRKIIFSTYVLNKDFFISLILFHLKLHLNYNMKGFSLHNSMLYNITILQIFNTNSWRSVSKALDFHTDYYHYYHHHVDQDMSAGY